MSSPPISGPHQGQPVLTYGRPLADASAAMILVHGRGAGAADILSLAPEVPHPGLAYLAPEAARRTWYPYSFLAPWEANEPGISSGLARLGELVARVEAAGIPAERIILGGFSQGACLVSEFAAQNPRRYGGLLIFSGGVIGPLGMARTYTGSLAGTPVFIGCSDVDHHIPLARVEETAAIMQSLGADVTKRIYPNMGHTINQDEFQAARHLVNTALGAPARTASASADPEE